MRRRVFPPLPAWLVPLTLAGVCLGGCGSGSSVRVQGRVTVDGQPLPEGIVIFQPDPSRDNPSQQEARGAVQPDGSYDLCTNGRAGAAPGWYKVSVVAVSQRTTPKGGWTVRTLIARKYSSPATSGLELEVRPDKSPGAYDLALQGARRR